MPLLELNIPGTEMLFTEALWGLIVVDKITNKIVREVILKNVTKNKSGKQIYRLKHKKIIHCGNIRNIRCTYIW